MHTQFAPCHAFQTYVFWIFIVVEINRKGCAMQLWQKRALFFWMSMFASQGFLYADKECKESPFCFHSGDHTFKLNNRLKVESLYALDVRLLNRANQQDQLLIPARHIWDLEMLYGYGNQKYACDVIRIKTGIRNRGTWGAPESLGKTATASIKDTETVMGAHRHPIPVHVPIIRELWMQYTLNPVFGFDMCNCQAVQLGLFPFQLGRGISLGNAYATAPEFIGYNPADAVQQFAPGVRIGGKATSMISYDLYAAILDNKSDTFENTNEKIRGHEYGHRFDQARGYGTMNYLVAAHMFFEPQIAYGGKLKIEPYLLHNHDDEQKVEFLGDAYSRLTTLGAALEATFGCLEFGCDLAMNMGSQHVKGTDSNVITRELNKTTGAVYVVNSKIFTTIDGNTLKNKAPFIPLYQERIYAVAPTIDNNSYYQANGTLVPKTVPTTEASTTPLYEAVDRFSDPYDNVYGGSMFVADATYAIIPELKVSAAVGYASGDDNPNRDLDGLGDASVDGTYNGFISLQETYSGKRVRSAFLMSGSGKIPRITAMPVIESNYTSQVSQFTNLAFLGGALWVNKDFCGRTWKFNPNVLSYWQTHASRVFDRVNGLYVNEHSARTHLGAECNLYIDTMLPYDVKLGFVGGFFVPGAHFDDILGVPLNKEEQTIFDKPDRTGVTSDTAPVHGNDTAFFWNVNLEYAF